MPTILKPRTIVIAMAKITPLRVFANSIAAVNNTLAKTNNKNMGIAQDACGSINKTNKMTLNHKPAMINKVGR